MRHFRVFILSLLFVTGTIAVTLLSACQSARKAVSASDTASTPRKIVSLEDLPPGIQFNKTERVHYVQLYPEDKLQTGQPVVVVPTMEKEEPAPLNDRKDKQSYREDAAKDLITTRAKPVFYVVAGSFLNKQNALGYAEKLKNLGFRNSEIQLFDNRFYRVIQETFTDEKEARRFVSKFSKDYPDYSQVWILQNQ